ncbi:unnamed protein product, partial [Auanema sp. JU1783]
MYATTRASIRYLNSEQLLEQIGQRINVTEFDNRMITAPGDTYRERAELIAKNLTFTPGVVSSSLSVPTPNEVLKAFLHASPPNAKAASVNAFLLDEARELAQDLLSLKTERFNADLAQADDALFKKLNSIPDITPFESLTRNDGSNYGMVYKPEPSF